MAVEKKRVFVVEVKFCEKSYLSRLPRQHGPCENDGTNDIYNCDDRMGSGSQILTAN